MRVWRRPVRSILTIALSLISAIPLSVDQGVDAGAPFTAAVRPIDPALAEQMMGVSWRPGCPVSLDELRVITMNFWGFDDQPHEGRLVVNEEIAQGVIRAFRLMYDARFPIRRMEPIEEFGGDDDLSMEADNTSAFNCRFRTGSTTQFSVHSYGYAIDINTVENPYVSGSRVLPPAGRNYLERDDLRPGMFLADDLVVKALKVEGFIWGGDWTSLKDYQHFEFSR